MVPDSQPHFKYMGFFLCVYTFAKNVICDKLFYLKTFSIKNCLLDMILDTMVVFFLKK